MAAIASYVLTEAIAYGKGGPSYALHEIQSIIALILEIIFLNKVPSTLQIVGFAVGFVGGSLIAFQAKKETLNSTTKI